jgi:uncharacterized coiled-coil DUF342 family protein
MTSTSETGHAKNVANFNELISFVSGYGGAYNPSKASIKLTALQTLLADAMSAMDAVNAAMPAYSNAVSAREAAFEPLNKLITRVMNAVKASDISPQVEESVKSLVRKIQGTRATAKKTDAQKAAMTAEGKEVKEISSSQMSYENRLDNFDKLIQLLSSIELYAPNEPELKITALTELYNDLKDKNKAVVNTATPLSNARIARNNIFYKADTGLMDIAADVKTYIKSLFGASSPQYKQVSKLEFKGVKI